MCIKCIYFYSSIRQRAHSTSDRPPQFCIKDMAAFFEQKQ